ncbi:MAG: xanthine dehydrogenase small subunit, partial [Rubrivivax sp.]|nr:xanthine dehydrogenase small subunit [Rubrivivax sp.]
MNTRPLRFFHQGQVVQIDEPSSTRSVLQWLREDARCTGTKEGCAEGDCGACTVVLGTLDASGELALQPVNACIQFLPTLDGKALFTVEDLSAAPASLHPVQQSLVACHASQCGFCTPGFVMSLWACYEGHQQAGTVPTRQQLADDLSGNLCRCTGYRPILDAGQQMFQAPAVPLARQPVVEALKSLAQDPPLHTAAGFHAPRCLADFAALRESLPQAKVLAGSTDMGLWVTKQFRDLGELISINEVAELKTVTVAEHHITIGAAASLQSAWQALVADWPTLRDVWLRFASLPIRHAGTMGGNVANGSPIGDSAPALIALGATLVLQRGALQRRMALEDFYVDYMKNRLEPGEFLHSVEVPRPDPAAAAQVRVYKISKRFDCDISAVCAALSLRLDGDRIAAVRLAWGGLAGTVKRAAQAEAALLGQVWNESSLQAAQAALAQDFKPLTDMRASASYRLQVAQNL